MELLKFTYDFIAANIEVTINWTMIICMFIHYVKSLLDPWLNFPTCFMGMSQSPIDINPSDATTDPELGQLQFSLGYMNTLRGHVVNNGHTGEN